MKVVARLVEVIGDDEWVDETIRRSIDGVVVILPGRRLVRSKLIGCYLAVTPAEIERIEAMAGPRDSDRVHSVKIDGEDEP